MLDTAKSRLEKSIPNEGDLSSKQKIQKPVVKIMCTIRRYKKRNNWDITLLKV